MGEAVIEMPKLGEAVNDGLEASNEVGDASELNDNISEAKESLKKIKEDPEIKKIKEDVDRQLSKNAADANEKAENYQNSEGRFHEELGKFVEKETGVETSKGDAKKGVENYKPGERSGNTKQDAINETLDKATQNLKDNLPADSKTFTDRLKSLVNSTNEVAGKIFKGYAGLSMIGVISAIIYKAFKEKDKTLDEIVQGAAGCYQKITDDKGVVYYVGPCKCGFDLENKLSGTCKEYDATNGTPIANQIKDAAFCQTSTFSNLKTPCLISKVACKSINNGGTCQDGTCDNKDCQNNPNSPACKWKNEKGNVKVESFAFCGNSSDIMMKMIALSNSSDQWAPQPPPPITIAISIIGGLIILITVVWYILLLIRKERQMGKKK
tara:strand:+ start:3381 stop:4526 length:1146 start_codon:yes stop_codon:yes gene_type:complete